MTKPGGWLIYTGVVAGGPGTATVTPFATDDINGDRFGGSIPDDCAIIPIVVVRSYGSAIIAGPRLSMTFTASGGIMTGITVVLTNDNVTVGNNIGYYLTIGVLNRLNVGL